jgi:predicted HAD superfamily Cof-like phosphohydrolase
MTAFKPILADELSEVDDIITHAGKDEIDDLVALSDWLGDIIVYCTSEAMRYGIPIGDVLEVIMESNFSKLGADGLPIIRDSKVQKGPNYWKPEPKIREVLLSYREGV